MQLPDLKALDKIIALCRRRGVKSIKIDNVELTLSEDAPESTYKKKQAAKVNHGITADQISSDEPSESELLFWSSGGLTEEEANKA